MAGPALEDELTSCVPDDARDDAERRPGAGEHGALLDVELDVRRGRERRLE
jgi:hypothetical protein